MVFTSSGYNFLIRVPVTSSGYKFRLQVQVTSSGYKFRLQVPVTSSGYKFQFQVPVTNSGYRFRLKVAVYFFFPSLPRVRVWCPLLILSVSYWAFRRWKSAISSSSVRRCSSTNRRSSATLALSLSNLLCSSRSDSFSSASFSFTLEKWLFKGTVSEISGDLVCKDGKSPIHNVTFKLCLIKPTKVT